MTTQGKCEHHGPMKRFRWVGDVTLGYAWCPYCHRPLTQTMFTARHGWENVEPTVVASWKAGEKAARKLQETRMRDSGLFTKGAKLQPGDIVYGFESFWVRSGADHPHSQLHTERGCFPRYEVVNFNPEVHNWWGKDRGWAAPFAEGALVLETMPEGERREPLVNASSPTKIKPTVWHLTSRPKGSWSNTVSLMRAVRGSGYGEEQ